MYKYFEYADFYLGGASFHEGAGIDDGVQAELSCLLHETQVGGGDMPILEAACDTVKMFAEDADLTSVEARRGEGLSIELLSCGKPVASVSVDVYVDDEYMEAVMPNGDTASSLLYYGWDEFASLE